MTRLKPTLPRWVLLLGKAGYNSIVCRTIKIDLFGGAMIGIFVLAMLVLLLWNLENSGPSHITVGEVLLKDESTQPRCLLICIKREDKQKVSQAVEVDEKLFELVREGGGVIVTYRRGGLTGRTKILEVV